MQRYAMPTVDNLLDMEHCESCDRELAAEWKYCIYCGRPVARAAASRAAASAIAATPSTVSPNTVSPSSAAARSKADKVVIPSAIRADIDEPPGRKYDAPFWVGVGMGVLGLALIIYAAVLIYGS